MKDRLLVRKIILMVGDALVLLSALFLSLSFQNNGLIGWLDFVLEAKKFLPIAIVWLAIFALLDFYHYKTLKSYYKTLYTIIIGVIFSIGFTALVLYGFSYSLGLDSRSTLTWAGVYAIALLVVWRFIAFCLFLRIKVDRRVMVVGDDRNLNLLSREIKSLDGIDYQIIGAIGEHEATLPFLNNIPFLGLYQDFKNILSRHKIDELVMAFDYREHPQLVRDISDSLHMGIKVNNLSLFYEQVYRKIPINHIDHFWFVSNTDESDKKNYERIKRLFDIFLALVGLIIFLILLPFIAFGIKITSKGPVFYGQTRAGKDERLFTLYKFRTMSQGAEKNGAQWAVKDDPRVTSFGRFLRRTRLDESPQLLNILRGEMSFVGPRPERPEFIPLLKEKVPFYYKRSIVRPGVTGFAQIMYPYAASVEDSLEKIGYDLYYIKNRSMFLYFRIVFRTIRTMLSFRGQ